MGKAIQDTIGPVGEIDIPEKHAFLAERIQEFNATIPYSGFSQAFLDQMNRPGRFEKEARRRAYTTVEAIFCLLPLPKKVRIRPHFLSTDQRLADVVLGALPKFRDTLRRSPM
jgi:hypothetical protein